MYTNPFLAKNYKFMGFFLQSFFAVFQKFCDFRNSYDCIGKITSKSIKLFPVFIQKRVEFNKKK